MRDECVICMERYRLASLDLELVDGRGRDRATIWQNAEARFTWHTWDDRGTGGENSEAASLDDAKRHCVAAIVRQGWAPGGWEVSW